MPTPLAQTLPPLLLALLAGAAAAQTAQAPLPSSSPAEAPLLPHALHYQSVFDAYRAYVDQPVLPWREANDLVGRIGGWRTYAREGAAANSPTPAPAHQHREGASEKTTP